MAVLEKLKESGWFLTEEGLKKVTDEKPSVAENSKEIIKTILDYDYREIGGGAFPPDITKIGKLDQIPGNIVVQICKITNASAPKANPKSMSSPRLLKIELSDGQVQFPGLEYESCPELSLNTMPGTKILLKNGPIKISNGFLLFSAKNIQILGGKVAHLIEKFEAFKLTSKYAKFVVRPNTGAPSWSMFGKSMAQLLPEDKSFKSLTPEQEKENAEFTEMRTKAIEEAVALQKTTKKQFGRGKTNIMDHNIQKIIDKGYTMDQAQYALKSSRNNLERAFASLKRQTAGRQGQEGGSGAGRGGAPPREERGGRRGGRAPREEVTNESRPSGKLSLFDFLEDKLPVAPEPIETTTKKPDVTTKPPYRYDQRPAYNKSDPPKSKPSTGGRHSTEDDRSPFENNISASFRQKSKDDFPPSHNRAPWKDQQYGGGDRSGGKYDSRQTGKRPNFSINNRPSYSNQDGGAGGGYNGSNNQRNEFGGGRGGYNQSGRGGRDSRPSQQPYQPPPHRQNNHQGGPDQQQPGGGGKGGNYGHSQSSYNQATSQQNNDRGAQPPRFQSKRGGGYHHSQQQQLNQYNNNQRQQAPSTQSHHQYNNNMTKVTEGMSKMNVVSQQGQGGSKHHQQQQQSAPPPTQPQQSSNNFAKAFPQAPNGYGYNPYKIVGFQNKEANEFAISLLKQQQDTGNFNMMAQPPPHLMQVPSAHHQPPPPVQVQHHPSQSSRQTPSPFPWKQGDRCLAKYWEDKRFYAAEITGISDRTVVVNFLEYGNFEEILKHDILPLNETQFYQNAPGRGGGHHGMKRH